MDVSVSAESPLVAAGILGSTVILGSVAAGQPVAWWAGLVFTLFFIWQFKFSRDFCGPVRERELQRFL
jgi:hypothetical protein